MKMVLVFYLTLLPLGFAVAAEPSNRPVPVRQIDKKDIALEDLAHSFFFHHSGAATMLPQLISEDGVRRLQSEINVHSREMNDARKIVAKLRKACSDLQNATSGQEFAAVFIRGEESERDHSRLAVRQILATLDEHDRGALESYLDKEYRELITRTKFDYDAMFAAGPFPSAQTDEITRRTCDSIPGAEARVKP